MKYILLSLFFILINSVTAQVDSKGKLLDNSFDCKVVVSSLKNEINYENFGDDGFIRFEGNKVQLFDEPA